MHGSKELVTVLGYTLFLVLLCATQESVTQVAPINTDPIQFTLLSKLKDTPKFSLTAFSVTYPTSVNWYRDQNSISNGVSYTISPVFEDTMTLKYTSTLTVQGWQWLGTYRCQLADGQGVRTNSELLVQTATPPTLLAVTHEEMNLTVTWQVPASSSSFAPPTGYVIFFTADGDEGRVSIEDAAANRHTITGRRVHLQYFITMVTISAELPSVSTPSVTGVYMTLKNHIVPNHGLVSISDIGSTTENALVCVTGRADCCGADDVSISQWFQPNGLPAPAYGDGVLAQSRSSDAYRPNGYVFLHYNGGNVGQYNEGIYRCLIPSPDPHERTTLQERFVGLYRDCGGVPHFTSGPQFKLISLSPLQFMLTCFTVGGPVSHVLWMQDNLPLSVDHMRYVSSRVLVNPETAEYRLSLSVFGKETGEYCCAMRNDRSAGIVKSNQISLTEPSSPTKLTSTAINATAYYITWKMAPEAVDILNYEISFTQIVDVSLAGCGDLRGNYSTVNGTATGYILSGLGAYITYHVQVIAVNVFGTSGAATLTLTTPAAVPSEPPQFVRATQRTETTVTIAWFPVPCQSRNSKIVQYAIKYSMLSNLNERTEFACGSSGAGGTHTLFALPGDETYRVQVAAVSEAGELGPYSGAIIVKTRSGVSQWDSCSSSLLVIVGVACALGSTLIYSIILAIILYVICRPKSQRSQQASSTDRPSNSLPQDTVHSVTNHTALELKQCEAYGESGEGVSDLTTMNYESIYSEI